MLGYVNKMQMQSSTETELGENNILYHINKALSLFTKNKFARTECMMKKNTNENPLRKIEHQNRSKVK